MIELVLVIVVLGILAVMALPMFTNVTGSARTNMRDGIVAAVREAINLYRAEQESQGNAPSYPLTLDGLANNTTCSAASPCFSGIMKEPVTDGRWVKVNGTQYTWAASIGGAVANTYNYNSATGTFQ